MSLHERLLVVLLRIGGVVTSAAFLAVFLPVEWMAATHQWLGLGEFPRAPVVDYLAHEVAVMYQGRIVEHGPVDQVLRSPSSGYTRELLAAVPEIS